MSEILTVANANTYYGQLVRKPGGLLPLSDAGVDVLCMQEVHGFSGHELADRLADGGFTLVHVEPAAGLAIAVSEHGSVRPKAHETMTAGIQSVGFLGRTALSYNLPGAARLRPRSLIGVGLATHCGAPFDVYTAHPIVFLRPLARRTQVTAIASYLAARPHPDIPAFFAADMNHYPEPNTVDKLLHDQAGFDHAPLDAPTWRIRGSKHEWAARIISAATSRPLNSFDAQLDSLWYAGADLQHTEVLTVMSDHGVPVGRFKI